MKDSDYYFVQERRETLYHVQKMMDAFHSAVGKLKSVVQEKMKDTDYCFVVCRK